MKKITYSTFLTKYPNSNYDYFSKLDDKELYLDEVSKYYELLMDYLIKNTDIKKIDDEIKNCKDFIFDIENVKEDKIDFYQFVCNNKLSFFYVRSNIYIERLDENEKKFLDSLIPDGKYNDEVDLFIKKTYSKVTSEGPFRGKEKYLLNYGPSNTNKFFASNNTLVIGSRMDEYVNHIDNDKEREEYFKRFNYFETKSREVEENLKEKLNYDVKVIIYDESSVKILNQEKEKTLRGYYGRKI